MSRRLPCALHLRPPGVARQYEGSSRKLARQPTQRTPGRSVWLIQVQLELDDSPVLAIQHEGEHWYPACFRDSSKIRLPGAPADLERPAEPGLEAQ
jgi:hypothetical protein